MFVPLALLVSCILLTSVAVQKISSGPVEDKYSCPHGWTRYGSRKCLKYVNELQDYERAQATCRSKNQGQLVTIHSQDEQNFVYTYIHSIAASSTPIWLGAKQIDFESILWLDKTENSYTNWAASEPSHPDEICIAINPRNGMWHDVLCTEANVPACERAPTTQWPFFVAFCSEGWFQFNDEKCVRIISSQALNFYESQELCRSKYNSKLLSIKSDKESEFVHNLIKFRDLKLPVWLGAVQNDFSSFNWIDKSDITFTNWAESEPNDPDHACISMTASGGKWSDNDCKEQKLILCQKAVPEEGSCETGWLQFRQDTCYRFVHIRLTFDDAETLCSNLYGGHLPSIHSQEEQFMITQFLTSVNVKNGSEIWLGGRQMDFHNFNWGDGSMFNYSYWDHNEPNLPAENCIEMSWRNGRWNDIQCRLKRAVLCERQVTSRHQIKPILYQSTTCLDGLAANCTNGASGGASLNHSQSTIGMHHLDNMNAGTLNNSNLTTNATATQFSPSTNFSGSDNPDNNNEWNGPLSSSNSTSANHNQSSHNLMLPTIDDQPIKVITSIMNRDPQNQQHPASPELEHTNPKVPNGANATAPTIPTDSRLNNTTVAGVLAQPSSQAPIHYNNGPQVEQQAFLTAFEEQQKNNKDKLSPSDTSNGFLVGKKDQTLVVSGGQNFEISQTQSSDNAEELNRSNAPTVGELPTTATDSLLSKLKQPLESSTQRVDEQRSTPAAVTSSTTQAPDRSPTTITNQQDESDQLLEKITAHKDIATKEPTPAASNSTVAVI